MTPPRPAADNGRPAEPALRPPSGIATAVADRDGCRAVIETLAPLAGGIAAIVVVDGCADDRLELVRMAGAEAERVLVVVAPDARAGDDAAWRLLGAGADDVLSWDALADPVAAVRARLDRWSVVAELAASRVVAANLVGADPCWRRTLRGIVEAARFGTGPILLTGETGTGKELVARLIHALGERPGPLVVLDCTTIVPDLSGSELWGHERGSFTGALGAREGAFALAHGGTLFLDEVGELPAALQPELLRVVQEGTYKRVGSDRWRSTEFRLVCATNRELSAEVALGRFRGDLLHRLGGTTCVLPPLRDRRGDVLPLVRHFLREIHHADVDIDPALTSWLQAREYRGNVRELRQVVLRLASRYVGVGPLTVGTVPPEERPAQPPRVEDWRSALEKAVTRALEADASLRELVDETRDAAVRAALLHAHGRTRDAARRLGVTDRALQLRRARAGGNVLAGPR